MMKMDLAHIPLLPDIGGDPHLATPFDRWKIQQVITFNPLSPLPSCLSPLFPAGIP
jgi:hypothetical protein